MNKILRYTCLLLCLSRSVYGDNQIEIPLINAPQGVILGVEQDARQKGLVDHLDTLTQQTPGHVSQHLTQHSLQSYLAPSVAGFVALYGGYIDRSDRNGIIAFPLRHESKKLLVAITPQITLVRAFGNTFSHREYINNAQNPAKLYSYQLQQSKPDPQNPKQPLYWYWSVTAETLPVDKKVTPITVVILTDPNNVYIDEGNFLTAENAQLAIPPIYVLHRNSTDAAILQNLDIRPYFEPIITEEKKVNDTTLQKLIKNN